MTDKQRDASPHERSEYRIAYPLNARPQLQLDIRALPVVDLSEHGARMLVPATTQAHFDTAIGDRIEGLLALAHGPNVAIRGQIVRRFADGFAVAFDEDAHIILLHIINEQRYLREQFPD